MCSLVFKIQDYHLLWSAFPRCSSTLKSIGSSPFARRYLGNLIWCLFLRVLRCFTSPRSPTNKLVYLAYGKWVSPFRNLRITGYCRLPEAYRRLSRLSSPLTAKASTMCASLLDHTTPSSLSTTKACIIMNDNDITYVYAWFSSLYFWQPTPGITTDVIKGLVTKVNDDTWNVITNPDSYLCF